MDRRDPEPSLSPRLRSLPRRRLLGLEVAVAVGFRARLLGLSRLPREQAGEGLLIPRCSSVHTIGMRFSLDLVFLDGAGRVLGVRRAVSPRRIAWRRGAAAVLELARPTRSGSAAGRSAGGGCDSGSGG